MKSAALMFRNGIYKICYGLPSDTGGLEEHALAVLRDGKLIGSDRHGSVFVGEPVCSTGPLESFRIQLTIPPGGELITGYRAGPQGSILSLRGQFDPTLNIQTSRVDVAGGQVELRVAYLGPLPE